MPLRLAVICLALLGASCATTGSSSAEDRRWINQCIRDNADEGPSRRVVAAYCNCMVNRMSDNETRSVTQWERANPRVRRECSRQAGWD
jgi:hypothetical protein